SRNDLRLITILYHAMQGSARITQCVNPLFNAGIFDKLRSMVRFFTGIDNQRTAAAPMFVAGKTAYAMDIVRGVAARKGNPYEVIDVGRGECRIVAKHH